MGFLISKICIIIVALIWILRRFYRPIRRRHRIIFPIILIIVIFYILLDKEKRSYNYVVYNKILWAPNWVTKVNPLDGSQIRYTRFGGSELRFSVSGSRFAEIMNSGINMDKGIGFDLYINDILIPQNKYANAAGKIYIPFTSLLKQKVRIRFYCNGLPECQIGITDIYFSKGTNIEAVNMPSKSIALFGDSISSIYGSKNFSYLISDKLNLLLHNASVTGSVLSGSKKDYPAIERYKNDVVAYDPDLVVISLGTNDVKKDIPLDKFTKTYMDLLLNIRKDLPESQIITLGLFRRKDIPNRIMLQYDDIIRNISSINNVEYVRTVDLLNDNDYLDVVHPSLSAQEKIFEYLLPVFNKAVNKI